jgi:acyl carrier protein
MSEPLLLQQQIAALFEEKLNVGAPSVDTDLIGAGLLDSLALVELMSLLEETFGVSISIDDIELENFRSIASIASFVADRASMSAAA